MRTLNSIDLPRWLCCSSALVLALAASTSRAQSGRPWEVMDYGPTLTASIEARFPSGNIAQKGLLVRLDRDAQTQVIFDTDLLRYSAGWTGGLINWRSVVFDGSHNSHPSIMGPQAFGNPAAPGWAGASGSFADPRPLPYGPLPKDWARWRGHYMHGEKVVLSYTVGGTGVLESPGLAPGGLFTRTVQIEKSPHDLTLQIVQGPSDSRHIFSIDNQPRNSLTAPASERYVVFGELALPRTAKLEGVSDKKLLAHWKLDENRGQVVGNAAGSKFSGTLASADWTTGHDGAALRFKKDARVEIDGGAALDFATADFTISAWIRTKASGTILARAPKTGPWAPGGKTFFVRDGRLGYDVGWVGYAGSSRKVNDGRWRHVALTFHQRSQTVQLYVDGLPDGKRQLDPKPDDPAHAVRLGYTSANFPRPSGFRGDLDDVRFYQRQLKPAEIRTLAGRSPAPKLLAVRVAAAPEGARWRIEESSQLRLVIPAEATPARFTVVLGEVQTKTLPNFPKTLASLAKPKDLTSLTQGGPPRWPERLVTQGQRGDDNGPYTIDTITAPVNNPWRSWLRFGGFDFFPGADRAAICTWNGDVWLVDGLDDTLQKLTWRRIASGMFQPLGVKIVAGDIYVTCRDQITVLRDLNGDGETDFYQNFNNDHQVTEHFHEFAMDLQTDAQGNFYYAKSARHAKTPLVPHHGTLIKVAPDGSSSEIVCNGFRAANGVGIGPHGELATSDQEGHWTPANRINFVEPGGFYGNVWSYHQGPDPTSYEPPLCWLPKNVDRSPAEQLWVTSDRWGPLRGSLLSTSYGTGQLFLVPYERVAGKWQGGATRFPLDFPTGVMRARFSPRDGQLYACGLFGWSSNKTKPGGFFRIRYTEQPVRMPKSLRATEAGMFLTFTEPLDRATAEDAGRWSVERWNYRWTKNYGSKHYSVAHPDRVGQDSAPVTSASLLDDGKTVFLAIDDMRPVMQMKIAWSVKAADGAEVRGELYNTIHALAEAGLNLPKPTTTTTAGEMPQELKARLQPGLLARFEQRNGRQVISDTRRDRLAALFVPPHEAPTPFLKPGPFAVVFDGFIKAELTGDHEFHLEGNGQATLAINGREVWRGNGDLSKTPAQVATLRQGYNRLALRYERPEQGAASVRLFWSGPSFDTERVSPLALACDGADPALAQGAALRTGRRLFAMRDCAKCHQVGDAEMLAMPEMSHRAPVLTGAGARLNAAWVYHWILNPRALRGQATMPRLFHGDPALDKRQAADIAAWIGSLAAKQPVDPKPNGTNTHAGEILFENLGCISCHTLAPAASKDSFQRVSLHLVGAKFRPGALFAFLRQPHAHHAFSRMPDFKLSKPEASELAGFLRGRARGQLPKSPDLATADVRRGRQAFYAVGCANCHHAEAEGVREKPRFLASVLHSKDAKGCLAAGVIPARSPDYALTSRQRAALAAFIHRDGGSLRNHVAAEAAERFVQALNCQACHQRDAQPAAWPEILLDEGSQGLPPEIVPPLTWAGEKLTSDWLVRQVSGTLGYRSRPWLKARMPAFPAYAFDLAHGLSFQHGIYPLASATTASSSSTRRNAKSAEIGHRLTLKQGGFNCRQCHGLGQQPAEAAFEARGVNFSYVADRLRYDYYRHWMLRPQRLEPGAKMPTLSQDGRTTPLTDVLEGDAQQQFDAIWRYLHTLDDAKKPRR